MITLRNLDQLLKENLKDKIVFVRVDLNIPIKDNLILDDTRIERIIPTIKELKSMVAKSVFYPILEDLMEKIMKNFH